MTEAMPFLQKAILLSYAPRPLPHGVFPKYSFLSSIFLVLFPLVIFLLI